MGQQQLLLVILVTIIVGVATVVAINIFGKSAENANIDATRQDVLTLAAMGQGWYIKPALLDGGGGSFANINIDELGFGYDNTKQHTATTFENQNATYTLTGTATQLTIDAVPKQAPAGTKIDAVVLPNQVQSLTVTRP